jgi:hypothetical protein
MFKDENKIKSKAEWEKILPECLLLYAEVLLRSGLLDMRQRKNFLVTKEQELRPIVHQACAEYFRDFDRPTAFDGARGSVVG